MNSNDFIELVGKNGNKIFINKHYIVNFCYRADLDSTEVFVIGDDAPFRFAGDRVDEIKIELNRLV